jgi:hypothetical protein
MAALDYYHSLLTTVPKMRMVYASNKRRLVVRCLPALSIILSAGGGMGSQILHSTTQTPMTAAVGYVLLMVLNHAVVMVAISTSFTIQQNMTPLQAFVLVAVHLWLLLAEGEEQEPLHPLQE